MKPARTRAIAVASVLSLLASGVRPGALAADTVDVNLAALPPGKSVTVRFSATVATPFPIGDTEVSTQGTVSGSNFSPVLTDDPDVAGMTDATVTPDRGRSGPRPHEVGRRERGGAGLHHCLHARRDQPGQPGGGDGAGAGDGAGGHDVQRRPEHAGMDLRRRRPAGTPCELALGTVAVSAVPATVDFAVNVSATPVGIEIENTATVVDDGANGADPTPLNNTATDTNTLDGPEADLTITKTNDRDAIVAGAATTYTITVANAGPDDVVGANVTDTPPGVLTGLSWTCVASDGAACSPSGTGAIDEDVDLPAGASVVYTLTGTLDAGATGTVANTASVTVPLGDRRSGSRQQHATPTRTRSCSGRRRATSTATAAATWSCSTPSRAKCASGG